MAKYIRRVCLKGAWPYPIRRIDAVVMLTNVNIEKKPFHAMVNWAYLAIQWGSTIYSLKRTYNHLVSRYLHSSRSIALASTLTFALTSEANPRGHFNAVLESKDRELGSSMWKGVELASIDSMLKD